jgi:excinuclease ABC subunit A
MSVPEVDAIEGLPPAVALQQQRGTPTTRSSVGSVTTLSNLLRMLYSRAGDYPPGQPLLYAESFSPNTPEGACPECHGLGRIYTVTEKSMVPDDSLTIRERAIAAWPQAWGGQNQRDILVTLGYDVDRPWRDLPKKDRDWILFTEDQPVVPVYAGFEPHEVKQALKRKAEPSYMGTFTSARRHVLHTFAHTQSALMKKRVSQFMLSADCPICGGKRLRREALSVTFAGLDIAEMSRLPLVKLASALHPLAPGRATTDTKTKSKSKTNTNTNANANANTNAKSKAEEHPEQVLAAKRIIDDVEARLGVLIDLGLGYLSLDRGTPTLSPGELQRLRLATQVRSNLFGVVYVLDEPSAGLHPADTEALLAALDGLKAAGNSLFVVEHDLDVMRHADWIVDVGPDAGEKGGAVLYSGPPEGLARIDASRTRRHLFPASVEAGARTNTGGTSREQRTPKGWLRLSGITRNNLHELDVAFPLGVFTTVTGVSGSGKSSLVSQALVELTAEALGQHVPLDEDDDPGDVDASVSSVPSGSGSNANAGEGNERDASSAVITTSGRIAGGMEAIKRLVRVDQRPIGRTPRSNLATYTGLFDHVRKLFAATRAARTRGYDAGRFSFNMPKGRCENCAGEGFVMVELLFLPSVYAPCPVCHGARYNAKTLEISYRGKTIADVLGMTVDTAFEFFAGEAHVSRALDVVRQVGLGYLRLGQPATELSGGEAQRIKLATELQRTQRGDTLYILDEPTTGLHAEDVNKLMTQLDGLVSSGNTVIVVEHDMRVVAASDHVIDMGPGAGEEGGRVVIAGAPSEVARHAGSRTAPFLARVLAEQDVTRDATAADDRRRVDRKRARS